MVSSGRGVIVIHRCRSAIIGRHWVKSGHGDLRFVEILEDADYIFEPERAVTRTSLIESIRHERNERI
jgi:hypothetical protein